MSSILDNPEVAAFLRRTVKLYFAHEWEADMNPGFVPLGIGVKDYGKPPEGRPEIIYVYALGNHVDEVKRHRFGRRFQVGAFLPEAYEEVVEILRRHGYESLEKIMFEYR